MKLTRIVKRAIVATSFLVRNMTDGHVHIAQSQPELGRLVQHQRYDLAKSIKPYGFVPYFWATDSEGVVYCYAERKGV